MAIKVGETKESLDCLEVSRGRPDGDGISLGTVHGDASRGDHETQELDFLSVEQTLLGF